MPFSSDRRAALSDALPRLAGPADPVERVDLLVRAVQALTTLDACAVLLADDGTVEAVAGTDDDGLRLAAAWDPQADRHDPDRRDPDRHDPEISTAGRPVPVTVPITSAPPSAGPDSTGPALLGMLFLLPPPGRVVTARELDRVSTVVAVAAAGLAQHRALLREQRTSEQLSQALESRVVIEQAKGVLAERGGIDPETAFRRLRHCARAQRRRLQDLAADVVRGDAADEVLSHIVP